MFSRSWDQVHAFIYISLYLLLFLLPTRRRAFALGQLANIGYVCFCPLDWNNATSSLVLSKFRSKSNVWRATGYRDGCTYVKKPDGSHLDTLQAEWASHQTGLRTTVTHISSILFGYTFLYGASIIAGLQAVNPEHLPITRFLGTLS